ncbi:hypothetical protein AGMMS50256_11500 [Betaproteobacteria bacterium]|nr:hypothetical protein AGMMS50256_11500 [Betaproteobacteria bacterium]
MKTITLEQPIKRRVRDKNGDTYKEIEITEIKFLEPRGTGWLKSTKLFDLMQMDVSALTTVLPRIIEPALTEHEILTQLHPADLVLLGAEVAGFLAPKSMTQEEPTP